MQLELRPFAVAMLLAMAEAAHADVGGAVAASLLDQADGLPADFREHFFDAPLNVRVERDGQYLGDAKIVLSTNNTVQLVEFTETHESTVPLAERERWAQYLGQPQPLGACGTHCANGLLALHYSLENSVLSLVTTGAERQVAAPRHYSLPENGSYGLILNHQLNLNAGAGQTGFGSYMLDAKGSIGNWTTIASYQLYRSGERRAPWQQSLQGLYVQREQQDRFIRLGYFLPFFQGTTRQPVAPNVPAFTTVGVMIGSSDTLAIQDGQASLVPLYVTPNRQGSVEVYRNGVLIYTQSVQPGLQLIDTRRLPGGIYEVEVRTLEDGQVISRENALINKPTHWRNLDKRWRYSAYVGQQRGLFDNRHDPRKGDLAIGGIVNYLAHPRAVLGASLTQTGTERVVAGSLDWHARDWANLFTNVYRSHAFGNGADVQALLNHRHGSITFNHGRSWQTRDRILGTRPGWVTSSAIAANQRFGDKSTLTARLSRSRGIAEGVGFDVAFFRRDTLWGSDANWRISGFDRPMTVHGMKKRNRGVDFSLNIALGDNGRRYQANVGSRTGVDGRRDLYGTVGVQQQLEKGPVHMVSAHATGDRYGLGLSGNALLDSRLLSGNIFAQRSSFDGRIIGGASLQSTMVVGGGKVASAGSAQQTDSGMIVDVQTDLPALSLRADDSQGGSFTLKSGRNFVPVTAYKSGKLTIDFAGRGAPAASIVPAHVDYHLNKGGIAELAVEVMRTVTVMGHIRDASGQPLRGAQLHNHVGRSVAEPDGFFTLEMSAGQPDLEVRHPSVHDCRFHLDPKQYPRDGDTVMVGALTCSIPQIQPIARGR